jgi:micrococcal nuclease
MYIKMGASLCSSYTYNAPKNISTNTLYHNMEFDYLNNVEYNDTTVFTFPIKYGKVVKIYDGDTITIAAKLPNTEGPIYRFSVRLNGIDTPEVKGKSVAERDLAKQAKGALHELLYGKIVELRNVANEKYGRILADVYVGDVHVNQWMVTANFAVSYDGGKKQRPDNWD